MRRELRGRRVLITGASSGIGRALAEEAAGAGMRVALTARSAAPLEELAQKLMAQGADALAIPADVTLAPDRVRVLQVISERWGGLDVLINNAGIATQGPFLDSSEDILRRVMEVNFFAPTELIRLAAPVLQKGQQPAVVNVSSMCGRRGLPMWSEYSASKFALFGLTEALRTEMVRHGIDVLAIVPGLTRTNLDQNLLQSDPRMYADFSKGMPPEQVAKDILTALRRNRSETVLGLEARWILRINRLWPWFVDRMFKRFVRRQYGS